MASGRTRSADRGVGAGARGVRSESECKLSGSDWTNAAYGREGVLEAQLAVRFEGFEAGACKSALCSTHHTSIRRATRPDPGQPNRTEPNAELRGAYGRAARAARGARNANICIPI